MVTKELGIYMEITGNLIYKWAEDIFPYNRSLTGNGVLETLAYVKSILPKLEIKSFKSGEQVFDWTIPKEWNVKDAFIADEHQNKIIDFKNNNLHLLGYSVAVDREMTFNELDKHLYSLEETPHAIPYITSYYKERWGFCLTHEQRTELRKYPHKKYHVKIDSTLTAGNLHYGELLIPGKTDKEIFLSTYHCHPSMGNNEVSGIVVTTALAHWLNTLDNEYSYRIIFISETIGSIAYLSRNLDIMKQNIIAGYVLSCVGDHRTYSHVKSRLGNKLSDDLLSYVLAKKDPNYKEYSFLERGSDERQYCSPGVDLPVSVFCRSKFGEYPEYHTSLDDLNLISPQGLYGSFEVIQEIIHILEHNKTYKTTILCEPQLGKRGLYPTISTKNTKALTENMTNLIQYSDGNHTLLDIAKLTNVDFKTFVTLAETLLEHGIITLV